MDKTEYQIKLDQINKLVDARDYKGALGVVETIDWRRVKSVRTLCMVADIYEANKMLRESKEILVLAYHRAPIGKMILYRLVELSLKMHEFDEAVEYYTEYVENASNDNSKYILKYKIYRARRAPIEEQIEILEKYKKWEYTERWAYELAKLYSRAGMIDKCIEECDDLILWFSEGKYVMKAMELKMQYQPLTPSQKEKYEKRNEAAPEITNRLIEKMDAAAAVKTEASQEPEKAAASAKGPEKQDSGEQVEAVAAAVTAGLAAAVSAAVASRGLSEAAAALAKEPEETVSEAETVPASERAEEIPETPVSRDAEWETPETDLRDTEDLRQRFSESFKDVLTRIRPQETAEEPEAESQWKPEESFQVRDLEPEKLDFAEEKKEPDLDLDAILSETTQHLAMELAGEGFGNEQESAPEAEADPVLDQSTAKMPVKELEEEILDQDVILENAIISQTMGAVASEEQEEKEESVSGDTVEISLKERKGDLRAEQEERELEALLPAGEEDRSVNRMRPEKLTDEQKKLFTYFVKVPGMDEQILDALHGAYTHTGDKTSAGGNIAIMGRPGTGKTRLSDALVKALCKELGMKAAKFASLDAEDVNAGDPIQIVANMSGGFLLIEKAGQLTDEAVEKLSQAMEFRTDSMILIAEDEKKSLQKLFANHPEFARKFTSTIAIPVFTNDELVTFARTYSKEMGYKIDDMAVLALYTLIGDNQDEDQPVTVAGVKDMVDKAIARAAKKKITRRKKMDENNRVLLYEKDFEY